MQATTAQGYYVIYCQLDLLFACGTFIVVLLNNFLPLRWRQVSSNFCMISPPMYCLNLSSVFLPISFLNDLPHSRLFVAFSLGLNLFLIFSYIDFAVLAHVGCYVPFVFPFSVCPSPCQLCALLRAVVDGFYTALKFSESRSTKSAHNLYAWLLPRFSLALSTTVLWRSVAELRYWDLKLYLTYEAR